MLLDISEILREVGSAFKFELNEPDLKLKEMELVSPVKGQISISNSGAWFLIRGNVCSDVVLQCGRCLRRFTYFIEAEIEEDFDIIQVRRLASRKKVDDQTMQVLFVGPAVDLNELIAQEFTLNLPLNPICSQECEILCPECKRPIKECSCMKENLSIDPRWQVLLDRINSVNDR